LPATASDFKASSQEEGSMRFKYTSASSSYELPKVERHQATHLQSYLIVKVKEKGAVSATITTVAIIRAKF
jgi:hypothetical protein